MAKLDGDNRPGSDYCYQENIILEWWNRRKLSAKNRVWS